jgi:hypothetical protein
MAAIGMRPSRGLHDVAGFAKPSRPGLPEAVPDGPSSVFGAGIVSQNHAIFYEE